MIISIFFYVYFVFMIILAFIIIHIYNYRNNKRYELENIERDLNKIFNK